MTKLTKPLKQSSGNLSGKLMLSSALILASGAYAWSQHTAPTVAQSAPQSITPPQQAPVLPQVAPPPQSASNVSQNNATTVPDTAETQASTIEAPKSQSQMQAPDVVAAQQVQTPATTASNAPAQQEAPTIIASNAPPLATPTQNTGQYNDGDFTGAPADTAWGLVQVRVSVHGGAIADIDPIDYPSHRRRSVQINSWALPILAREVIQAQSANVDIVSQATTTSVGYLQSLSTALAQAKKSP